MSTRLIAFLALFGFVTVAGAGCGCTDPMSKPGIYGDAVMLAENVRLSSSGTGWTAGGAGATANCIMGTDDLVSHFVESSNGSLVFMGVSSWTSEQGLTPITLASSLQTATATFSASNYVITGLSGAAVWGASDSLTVTSGSTVIEVPAPDPIPDPTQILGAADGLSTTISFPDGHCDAVTAFIQADMTSGAMRHVPEADIPLVGGSRVMPIADEATIAMLESEGLVPSMVYFSCMNEVETTDLFPGMRSVPVQAGRMFQVSFADLQ